MSNKSNSIQYILRCLEDENSWTNESYKFEVQDSNSLHCMKRIFSCIDMPKVIIAQAKVKEQKSSGQSALPKREKPKSESDEDDGYEFSGCPLETTLESPTLTLHVMEDSGKVITPTRSSQQPVPLADARKLLAFYNKIFSDNKHLRAASVPLLVFCDGADYQHTAMIGSYRQEEVFTTTVVSATGPLHPKAFASLSSIEEEHLQPFRGNVMTETEVLCHYHVLDSVVQGGAAASSLHVECRWNKVTSLLETPDANAICQLLIKVVSGEERSPAHAIYKELLFLKRLLQGLQTGEVLWSTETSDTTVIEKVKTLLADVKDGSQWRKTDRQKEDTSLIENFDSFVEAVVMGRRQNVEFTDHVWTALTECSSYAELKEALELVMDAIRARTIHPVVLRKNNTILGNWIRSMNQDASGIAEISLEGSAPLKLLVELGIEKLKKDYCAVFVGLGLATQESLQPLLLTGSNFEETAKNLDKLHSILELIVMCKAYLNLSKEILSGFARQVVKFYSSVKEVDPSHQFHFLVQLSAIRKAIDRLQPVDWEVCFKTANKNYIAYTCCQLTVEPPFSYLSKSCSDADKETASYFCTTANCFRDYYICGSTNKSL